MTSYRGDCINKALKRESTADFEENINFFEISKVLWLLNLVIKSLKIVSVVEF